MYSCRAFIPLCFPRISLDNIGNYHKISHDQDDSYGNYPQSIRRHNGLA